MPSNEKTKDSYRDWHHGVVFDVGGTTRRAINRLYKGVPPDSSGINDEWSQANGSLMRILPASLYYISKYKDDIPKILQGVHLVSSITHSHPTCQIACGIYTLIIKAVLEGNDLENSYYYAIQQAKEYYSSKKQFSKWLEKFTRILEGSINYLDEREVNSSGYVVDSLEAALWSVLSTNDFEKAVLKAVNLGEDTDTIGAITGGLAGNYYGYTAIPEKWVKALAKQKEIYKLSEKLANILKTL